MSDLFDLLNDDHFEEDRTQTERAPFGRVGGKHDSIPYLLPKLPYRKSWIDHFGGSGVVTLNRKESKLEVFNDRHSGIVAFYRCMRDKSKRDAMLHFLNHTLHSREEFYDCRNTWEGEKEDVVRAAKWFFISRSSVLFKCHSFARGTASAFKPTLPDALKLFDAVSCRMRGVIVENLHAFQCHADYDDEGAVHYFDPPYLDTDSGIYGYKWTRDDLSRLIDIAAKSKGFVAISHYKDEQLDKAGIWTDVHTWKVAMKADVSSNIIGEGKNEHKEEHLYIRDPLCQTR